MLDRYCCASGQEVNFSKSEVTTSSNVAIQQKEELASALGVKLVDSHGKYLGMPVWVGRSKTQAFEFLKDRVWKRLKGWKQKLLSFAGREVLLKAVAQAIPTYIMSLFRLPLGLCHDIQRLMARFWWGCKEDERKISWVAWDKMCCPKGQGGMGYRSIVDFNEALLAKQCWRIMNNPELLSSQILKARYFPSDEFINARVGCRPSYVWRSIWACRWVIEKGCKWIVGDGKSIRIWGDPWLSRPPSFKVISPRREDSGLENVADLIDPISGLWKEEVVREHFLDFEAGEVLEMPLASIALDDAYVWNYEKSGIYTVRSGYKFIRFYKNVVNGEVGASSENPLWQKIWGMVVPPKVRVFLWRMCSGALPTDVGLHKRVESIPAICSRCHREEETALHAVWGCSFVSTIWEEADVGRMDECPQVRTVVDWVGWWADELREEEKSKVATLAWMCWNERNAILHGSLPKCPGEVVGAADAAWCAFRKISEVGKEQRGGGGVHRRVDGDAVGGRSRSMARWKSPGAGILKINTDGAVFNDAGVGMGVMIRDEWGNVVRAACAQVQQQWDASVVEAKAIVLGLKLAIQCNSKMVAVESDCLQVIKLVKGEKEDGSYLGMICKEINIISSWFDAISFDLIYREANLAAHTMAHLSPLVYSTRVWIGGCPSIVEDVVASDFCLNNNEN